MQAELNTTPSYQLLSTIFDEVVSGSFGGKRMKLKLLNYLFESTERVSQFFQIPHLINYCKWKTIND